MAPNADHTRQQLIQAAEQLFAERGIHGVSLREINTAAGQRNVSALQYHFTGRDGLLGAVLAKHAVAVESSRHELLDAYEATGLPDIRALAEALVRPSAAKLSDPDGGRHYLQIHAQIVNWADLPREIRSYPAPSTDSIQRWRQLVGPLLPEVAVTRLHHRFTAIRVCAVELARRAEAPARRDDRLFTSHLVDLVAAVLTTPISDETARLIDEPTRSKP